MIAREGTICMTTLLWQLENGNKNGNRKIYKA
jgi:hypothetical protein